MRFSNLKRISTCRKSGLPRRISLRYGDPALWIAFKKSRFQPHSRQGCMTMTIDLTKPLTWKSAAGDELLLLQNLQGNILKGHGRDFANLIFFRLDTSAQLQSRRLLRELANYHITSAYSQ